MWFDDARFCEVRTLIERAELPTENRQINMLVAHGNELFFKNVTQPVIFGAALADAAV